MFPTLGMDFLNGIKLALKRSGSHVNPKFIIEGVGNAADDNVLKIAEKLILQEDVDLTVGFCSIFRLPEIITTFNGYKKPLIHVDLGGSILKKESTSPFVLHHTLGVCQASYAAGMHAATTFGKKGYVAASFYDGGYQITESFVRGYASKGGTVENYFVSPMDYKSETFEKLLTGIEKVQPDVLFTVFSYNEGKKVFDLLANSNLNGKIPIMAVPLMTDETINTEDHKIENVHSVASWSFDDESHQMQDFIKEFRSSYEVDPNIMALLGFEVGLTVSECTSEEGKIEAKLCNSMRNKAIDSPRGTLTYNAMNESQVESFKLREFKFNKINYHNIVVDSLDASFSEKLYSEFEPIPYTGWQNPYICT